MTKDYGSNAPLSCNKYLRVADLIGLQDCLSDPQHHDELLFHKPSTRLMNFGSNRFFMKLMPPSF